METKEEHKTAEPQAVESSPVTEIANAPPAPEADFGSAISIPEPADSAQLASSRISVLYDASSMFECAISATLKCEKAVAALPGHSDYAVVSKDLLVCNPHAIIILGTSWPEAFYKALSPQESSLILVLCEHAKQNPNPHILYIEPGLFTKLAPCKSEISAYIIFSHLMRSEYSRHFNDHLEDARYFRLALRSSIGSTLEAHTFVDKIVSNWQHVMDPENLVLYGRFLSTIGANIARKRIADHSILIKLGPHTIRAIECPDFEEVTMNVAQAQNPIVIVYSLSADTTQCRVTCRVRDDSANMMPASESNTVTKVPTPREILALITPRAEVGPECVSDARNAHEACVTCVASDFFTLIRVSIIQQQPLQTQLGSVDQTIIAEGEKVLKEAAPLLEGKN